VGRVVKPALPDTQTDRQREERVAHRYGSCELEPLGPSTLHVRHLHRRESVNVRWWCTIVVCGDTRSFAQNDSDCGRDDRVGLCTSATTRAGRGVIP
jgi:hypothetical protein